MTPKTFIAILTLFSKNFRMFKRKLNDKRLNQAERKILRGLVDFRNGDFSKIISEISPLICTDEITIFQKELLLGIAENNRGNPERAVALLTKASERLKPLDLPGQSFLLYSNLFVAWHNLKDRIGMEKALQVLDQMKKLSSPQKIQLLRCKCKYFGFVGNLDETVKHVKELEILFDEMSEAQKSGILLDQFIFYLRQDDFNCCESILEKMKTYRRFKLTANFRFMQKLLSFVMNGGSLYLYSQDFKEHPILFHQVNVLLALERGDRTAANASWEQLRRQSPAVYDANLVYLGDKCLFSMALERLLKAQIETAGEDPSVDSGIGPTQLQVLRVLEMYDGRPVSKEEIYEKVYGAPARSKDDLRKLATAVHRLKSKLGMDIVSKKGCFFLSHASVRKKAA